MNLTRLDPKIKRFKIFLSSTNFYFFILVCCYYAKEMHDVYTTPNIHSRMLSCVFTEIFLNKTFCLTLDTFNIGILENGIKNEERKLFSGNSWLRVCS